MKANDLIKTLEDLLSNLPHLPKNWRDGLVKFLPVITLVAGVIFILLGLTGLGLSPLALMGGLGNSFIVLIGGLSLIVSGVLFLLAYPKIKVHRYDGWVLLFWSEIVSVIGSVLMGNIVNGIITGVLGLYLLFEIKSYYK